MLSFRWGELKTPSFISPQGWSDSCKSQEDRAPPSFTGPRSATRRTVVSFPHVPTLSDPSTPFQILPAKPMYFIRSRWGWQRTLWRGDTGVSTFYMLYWKVTEQQVNTVITVANMHRNVCRELLYRWYAETPTGKPIAQEVTTSPCSQPAQPRRHRWTGIYSTRFSS